MQRLAPIKVRIFVAVAALFAVFAIGTGPAKAAYLVYDSGGWQDSIVQAMTICGFTFDVRNAANPVTAADLASHQALVIGWSAGGYDMTGLNSADLAAGITGNIILTGHDADFHTAQGVSAARQFMTRSVQFAGAASGCGILAFPQGYAAFPYLPTAWGASSFNGLQSDSIDQVTPAGAASGLYTGLSLADLSNWDESFHAGFTAWDPSFSSFEVGSPPFGTDVTIGRTKTPLDTPDGGATILLLSSAVMFLAAFRRRFHW
jgi:hypothetical protein